jgi:hypothetical protein
MLMSPVGLRSDKGCAGDARQKLNPTSRQRGRPTPTNQQLSKNDQRETGENWSRVQDRCLTPRWPGRLTVGRNMTDFDIDRSGTDANTLMVMAWHGGITSLLYTSRLLSQLWTTHHEIW